MIITKLQGGLGNQLFQWAYGKSLSLKYGIDFFLDKNFYNNQVGVTPRNYELNKFPYLKEPIFKQNECDITFYDNFNYKDLNYDKSKSYYLNGYWQSEKYFLNIEDVIRKELKPSEIFLNKISKIPFENSISLHVRRTDYVNKQNIHPLQTIDYYEKSLELIGNYDNIYVVSDDIPWCKENLKFDNINFVEGNDNVEDIWFMSLCTHNIIANSSFSWWGAWLNSNSNKKIVSPKNWFGKSSNLNSSEIIPNKWFKI